jgi:hypothetical protein
VNLNEVKRIIETGLTKPGDPDLEKAAKRAIAHVLGAPAAQARKHSIAYYTLFGALAFFFIVTASVMTLASLNYVHPQDKYLDRLWVVFGVDVAGLAGLGVKEIITAVKK